MAKIKGSEMVVSSGKIYHLGLKPGELARNIFVVGDPARADKVASYFNTIEHKANNREYLTRTGTYKGMPVSVVSTGIGTDNTEIALVEFFVLNEFDLEKRVKKEKAEPLTIIRIGTSGGLQKDIDVGNLAISSYALGLDSTGAFYQVPVPDMTAARLEGKAQAAISGAIPSGKRFRGKIYPYASKASPEVVNALKRNAEAPFAVGITVTAPGFFAPQGRTIPGLELTVPGLQEKLAEIEVAGQRIINFEMESSLLFHLAGKMGYRCGTICPIIANRPAGTFLVDYSDAVDKAIVTGLKAMHELYKKQ
ncbi:nucleoside phosphorylase [Candidatus Woesearchaeota archaeon]|nr:nucleoside phosphorylase [Candidatus Woesearchaeota archaeon]